jgi:hypothetical protein
MKRFYSIAGTALFYLVFNTPGATINSTAAGGLWGDASTWEGDVVPASTDDIVINGTVSVESARTCASVTVSSGAVLQNGGSLGWVVFAVTNATTNNGTIRNNPSGYELWIECNGDIENNGAWMPARTLIPTLKTQTISQAAGKEFNGSSISRKNNSGYSDTFALVAGSDIVFNAGSVDFNAYNSAIQYFWGIFNLDGHNLTLKGGTPFTGAVIRNAGVFSCQDSSAVSSSVIDSPVTLGGRFTTTDSKVTFNGDVTVSDTLQNGGSLGWVVVRFNRKLTNNGLIRNNPKGYQLDLDCFGDVANNGVWTPAATYFGSTKLQTISQTAGKEFCGKFTKKGYSGTSDTFPLIASSDIVANSPDFDCNGYNNGNYYWGKFNLAGHNLTLRGGTPLYGAILSNVAVFSCQDSSAVSSSVIDSPVTLGGHFTTTDSKVTFNGNVTVRDTLQNGGSLGWVVVRFNGKLTNNGLIRNNPKGYQLDLDCFGDVANNGVWTPAATYFGSTKVQAISQTAGKEFCGKFTKKGYSGTSDTFPLIASSDIAVNSTDFDCNGYNNGTYYWGKFNLAGHNLTLRGGTPFYGAILSNVAVFSCLDSSAVSSSVIDSPVTLGGHFTTTDSKVTFNGSVTVRDTLQNGGSLGWVSPVFNGKVVNLGLIRNNPRGYSMSPYFYNNFETYGQVICTNLYVVNSGRPAVLNGVIGAQVNLTVESGKTPGPVVAGPKLVLKKPIDINSGKTLEIPPYGDCTIEAGVSGGGAIVNRGVLRQTLAPLANGAQPLTGAIGLTMRVQARGSADTLRVAANTGTVHPALASSARRWWRIENDDTLKSYSIVLSYADSLLNGNDEKSLEAYLTRDNGSSWIKISTPVNVKRDTAANTLAVGSDDQPITAGSGEIVLSSGGIVIPPSISTSIIGRTDVRVGPPNRYTIAYWNNSGTAPTGPCFIQVSAGGGIFFKSAEVNTIDGKRLSIPRDSLLFDTASSQALFYVTGLAPGEVRMFDVIVTADRSGLEKTAAFVPFLGVAAVWLVTSMVEEYASNYLVSGCYEMWRPYEQGTDFKTLVKEGAYHTYKKTNAEFNVKEAVGKKVAEEVVNGVEKSIGRTIASPLFLAKDVLDCMKNMVNGMKDYVNGGFDKNERSLRKVTSWDPNYKAGPPGAGDKGYLATSAPVAYTIFFENKKQATAPAYTVTVRDTLDEAVFDPSSAAFGSMSHSMGVAKREGNVLTWVFDSIELPPNANPPEGEGWVQFTVKPKADLPTGTALKNRAVIVFDVNAPLATNTALNVLDFSAPKTDSAKAVFISRDSVEVSFAAKDSGSGVKNSSIFVSYDNAPFAFAGSTETGVFRFKTQPGVTPRFYVLSQDNVGNTEKSGAIFEATPVIRPADAKTSATTFLRVRPAFAKKIPFVFGLAVDSRVNIRVYDLRGRCIATIADGAFKSGIHTLVWNARNVGCGAYFVRMTAGKFRTQQKVLAGR